MSALLNNQVRKALALLPKRYPAATAEFLAAKLGEFFPGGVTADEVTAALQWNEARGLVDFRKNGDTEQIEWKLTEAGRIKEGLA